jgi:uncharacterized protein (TIGR02145 family)
VYKIVFKATGGTTFDGVSDGTYTILAGETIESFTDKTGAPGIIKCLPPAPYSLSPSASDVCVGAAVTFTLSGSASGWKYQLYKDNLVFVGNPVSGTESALTFTDMPAVGTHSYTVLTVDGGGVLCNVPVSVTHALTVNNVPTITRSGGEAIQTVNLNNAISPITFTANNGATTISRSGNLPNGLTGANQSNLVYTINGTPSSAGTYSYTITATGEGDCTTSTTGTIAVTATTPPLAASTQTWVISGNGITQTWSDRIESPSDCNKSSFSSDNSNPQCRSNTYNSVLYYHYNWPYVNANKNTLCPPGSGWRMPTKDDFINLDKALGGTGDNRSAGLAVVEGWYFAKWGCVYAGKADGSSMTHLGSNCMNWSATEYDATQAIDGHYDAGGGVHPQAIRPKNWGLVVRCVK